MPTLHLVVKKSVVIKTGKKVERCQNHQAALSFLAGSEKKEVENSGIMRAIFTTSRF